MITAELNHNPYLLLTAVRFNGQAPKINSQVEKYDSVMLKDWIHRIPEIYHDEMNGYDFDLYFTGTKSDFERLRAVFEANGISEEDVRLFHKNELEDAHLKSDAIDELIQWLRENRNRKFDFDGFYKEYRDHFESAYPYVVIRGKGDVNVHSQVNAEIVSNAAELEDTVLTNTPVLFCIDPANRKQSREDLKQILKRSDIRQNQLFFLLHPLLNADQVRRVILDLGVEDPQIVTSFDAAEVLAYIQDYPITEFVRDSIKIFRERTESIGNILDAENLESERQNAGIHALIDQYADQLSLLKEADLFFTERDNFSSARAFEKAQQDLLERINSWRHRKTKVVGDVECAEAAAAFDMDVARFTDTFVSEIGTLYQNIGEKIREKFHKAYAKQGMDLKYVPDQINLPPLTEYKKVSLYEELIGMKVVSFEEQKLDLKALFRITAVQEEKELVRVATCYYSQWRERVLQMVTPAVLGWIEENEKQLCCYYNALAEEYHQHLYELIEDQTREKDKVSAQLSDDERRLQEDNDWLATFKDKLTHIERG